jgi:hypothetical protein
MTPDDAMQSLTNTGKGQLVSLTLNETTTKWMFGMFGIVMAASLLAGILALDRAGDARADAAYAKAKAEEARIAAENADHNAKLAQYYTIDMEVYLYKQGIQPPPDPWRQKPKGTQR